MRCDSHVHIVGPVERYPQVANRTYLAGVATLATLEALAAARDVRRFVIVQPSFYGTDNTMLLESLDALAGRGRGVAVIDPAAAGPALLDDYAARGVRGLRINLYSPVRSSEPLAARFGALEAVAQARGWHIEVIAPLALVAENAALLRASSVPVVIDHYGLYGAFRPDQGEGRALIDLLRLPHVWMKLSAPYRVSDDELAVRADPAWLQAFLAAAPDRCVWGSDWPHTPAHAAQGDGAVALPYRKIAYDALVDAFIAAVGPPALGERILTGNPARLYDF
ncbi:MAG: amidohydrolase family protein [Pseudolabrys sp.]